MDLLGMRFGKFTVIEICNERVRTSLQVIVQCDCGVKRMYCKSLFTNGTYPEKCFQCHLKIQKNMLMARTKKEFD